MATNPESPLAGSPWDPNRPGAPQPVPQTAGTPEPGPATGQYPSTQADREANIAMLKVMVAEANAISQQAGQTWQQIAERIAAL
jgi:hypothetical protein